MTTPTQPSTPEQPVTPSTPSAPELHGATATAPAPGAPADTGLREAPGEIKVAGPLRRTWERFHLVPLLLLVLAVIAAAIAGGMTKAQLDARAALPPATAGAAAPGTACAPAAEPIPAEQPWQGELAAASEAAFQQGVAESTPAGHPEIVEGKDGWVFWGDYQWQNLSQGLGRRVLSTGEMDLWYQHYKEIEEKLAAQGIPFYVLIAPAKWDAYREQLPAWAADISGSTSFDYLRAAHPDLPIIDVRQAVVDAKATAPTYEPQNSHWTPYGGYAAWTQAASCLASAGGELAGIHAPAITGVETIQGSNEFSPYGVADGPAALTTPVWAETPGAMTIKDATGQTRTVTTAYGTDMLEMPATTTTADAQSQATALVLRDSYGNALAPGWQSAFATTIQIPHGIGSSTPADILGATAAAKPDVVILEMTERYLHFVPGQPAQH